VVAQSGDQPLRAEARLAIARRWLAGGPRSAFSTTLLALGFRTEAGCAPALGGRPRSAVIVVAQRQHGLEADRIIVRMMGGGGTPAGTGAAGPPARSTGRPFGSCRGARRERPGQARGGPGALPFRGGPLRGTASGCRRRSRRNLKGLLRRLAAYLRLVWPRPLSGGGFASSASLGHAPPTRLSSTAASWPGAAPAKRGHDSPSSCAVLSVAGLYAASALFGLSAAVLMAGVPRRPSTVRAR